MRTLIAILLFAAPSIAAPVSMGHHHLNTPDLAASLRFWELLGATKVPFGSYAVMKFPDLLVFLRETAPSGGSRGTTVNHVGLKLRNVSAKVDELKAKGVPIITREELADAKEDVYFNQAQKTNLAFVLSPEGAKVELFEDPSSPHEVANHHIHFYTPEIPKMKAWYVETFGAEPGTRGGMEAAQLPGVNLTFSPAASAVVGTKGRAVDHIGFEVDGLKAFCAKLESQGVKFDRPYEMRQELGVAVAFFTDPWGTVIELTEGLDALGYLQGP